MSRVGLVKLSWVYYLQYTANCFQCNVCDLCRCESSNHKTVFVWTSVIMIYHMNILMPSCFSTILYNWAIFLKVTYRQFLLYLVPTSSVFLQTKLLVDSITLLNFEVFCVNMIGFYFSTQ